LQKRIIITFFFLLCSASAFAQVSSRLADKGSVYSQYGTGYPVNADANGLGVWGVSDLEPLAPTLANPALWGYTVYGMASGGLQIKNYEDNSSFGVAKHSLVSVNHFQMQLPISKDKLGLSASFTPYTRRSFRAVQNGQKMSGSGAAQKMLNFQVMDEGNGGIDRIEVGVGWKINRNIAVGYAASLYHASMRDKYTTYVADSSYATISNTIQTSGSGFGNRLGLYLTFPLGGGRRELNMGAVVDFPVELKGEKAQQSLYVSGNPSSENADNERRLASGHIHLPLGITTGITFKPSRRVALLAEGRYQRWSKYSNNLENIPEHVNLTDRLKIGAGFKFYPVLSGSDKFLSQFKYRLGASYDSGNLKIKGENIKTLLFSAGLGLFSPTKVRGFHSSIDISFYYGIRGTKSHNLVKENIFGVRLSLNLAELFFFRPKLQ
jgi:hypothetical protein